jgi:hypothetical protein
VGKDFLPATPEAVVGRAMGVLQLRDDGMVPLISTCQNVFAGSLKASMPATAMLLCMGLFSIFWGSQSRVGPCSCLSVDDPQHGFAAVAREPRARHKASASWAHQRRRR